MCIVFEATWQTFIKKWNNWKGSLYFSMKTQLQLLCNRTFKTRTQDEMQHIEFHKIHLTFIPWKYTQDEMHLNNYFVA